MLKVHHKSTTDICENGIDIELILEEVKSQALFNNDEAHNSTVDLTSGLKEVADIETIVIQLEALKEQCDTRAFGPIFNSICSLDSQTYYDIICIIGFILRKLEVKKRVEFIRKIKDISDLEHQSTPSKRHVAPNEPIEAEAEIVERYADQVEAEVNEPAIPRDVARENTSEEANEGINEPSGKKNKK